MFGGQWKEADENVVCIDIPDENITKEGTVLYSDFLIHHRLYMQDFCSV